MTDDTVRSRAVLVIGTGLIGASVGLALREAGVTVWLSDADERARDHAIERGAGQPLEADSEPDVVVVAVPPRYVPEVSAAALHRYQDATVTDVASVKAAPLVRLRALTSDTTRFVGGHPMAGREVSGPAGARADLFEDRLWAITAGAGTDESRVADVRWLAQTCGSLVIELEATEHDRAVALTSHTPQILASVLAAQLAEADPSDVAFSGQGLRDTTRLADSGPELWTQIIGSNAPEIIAVLDRIDVDLREVRESLASQSLAEESGSAAAISPVRRILERGNEGRRVLPDKHGGKAHAYEVVPVVVDDRPGELARLFAAAGEAGVNLEDVRIEHTVGRLRAIIELDVSPESAPALRDVLAAGGWQIRG